MDTLDCPNFDSTLAVVKSMCVDYGNITKIKELELANNPRSELKEKLEKSEATWKALLWMTEEIHLDFDT